MNSKSIFLYQFGHRAAIQDVATSRFTVPVAIILVLCTAVARNYDQTYWRESAMFFLGPLIFSFFSGTLLYSVYEISILPKTGGEHRRWHDYWTFMGVFWMTAPIAWLYAIPAERMLSSMDAARLNLTLLAIVAAWRVALITRVLQVLTGAGLFAIGTRVMLVASIEMAFVSFFGQIFAGRMIAVMSGMRNAPEENLSMSALSYIFGTAFLAIPLLAITAVVFADVNAIPKAFPPRTSRKFPGIALVLLCATWGVIAIRPQAELARNWEAEKLVNAHDYPAAVDYLSRHSPKDFAPAKRLPPNPYEYPMWQQLPGMVSALDGSEAAWVRELYLGYLEISFVHRWTTFSLNEWAGILSVLDRLPEGPAWISTHRDTIREKLTKHARADKEDSVDFSDLRAKYDLGDLEEPDATEE